MTRRLLDAGFAVTV
ncbi:MAG: hypothetical protein L0J54_11100, partial [Halomonas sp.]|nr:hypothetical protein [Halomonas sp.]MDN6315733.1 hypothetical protein [Halomonas sp.]MDN6337183.1 hypothetical protein [Halomonas sp.]